MKIPSFSSKALALRSARLHRRGEDGMAVVVVIALLAILLIYVTGNARTLHLLGRDVKLVEQQQLRRLAAAGSRTNLIQTNVVPLPENSSLPQAVPK